MTIFISIAAYRDPGLVPTIRDCIARARHPDALRFGICWQHGDGEKQPTDFADPRFRVIAVPWRESRGACWAPAGRLLGAGRDHETVERRGLLPADRFAPANTST